MPEPEGTSSASLAGRFGAFVLERYPLALAAALEALDAVCSAGFPGREPAALEAMREPLRRELARRLPSSIPPGLPETTPGTSAGERLALERQAVVEACDGFLRREAVAASLTPEERREILQGMILT